MPKGKPDKKRINISGHRFGHLTAIAYHHTTAKHSVAMWLCVCDCGEMRVAPCGALRSGKVKSCGCLRKRRRHILQPGERFGRLTVLYETGVLDKIVRVKCSCDCGNTAIVRMGNLVTAHTRSCGCLRREAQQRNVLKALHRGREVREGIQALAEITELLNQQESDSQ